MGWIIAIFALIFRLLLIGAEAGYWLLAGSASLGVRLLDFAGARRRIRKGVLHCQNGHPVPTEGGTYLCDACGYTYTGSIWRCANPECRAHTPFVDCPVCGLSCRNPYRWGR